MPTAESEKSRQTERPSATPYVRTPQLALGGDPRWLLIERIAGSRKLGKSPRLGDFLRYVTDRQIRGKEIEITEQRIGVKVFGRTAGYNSNEDNIVRNYARTLRKRLNEYFRDEGIDEPMVVFIPRGGYVPIFEPRGASETVTDENSQQHAATEPDLPSFRPRFTPPMTLEHPSVAYSSTRQITVQIVLPVVVALLIGFLFGQSKSAPLFFQSVAERRSDILWRSLFEAERDTVVVPADGGLVMMQSFTRQKVALSEYVNGSYRSDAEIEQGIQGLLKTKESGDQARLAHKVSVLAARRYTSIVDLDLTSRLSRLKEVTPERLVVRFARDFRIDDLRTGNAVLIGSADANPWVSLFDPQLNFQFTEGNEFGGSGAIKNTHPLAGEQPSYASVTGDAANRTYGVIAYVPNLEGTGHVLLIEGVNMAGTQAAGDFLLNAEKMRPLIERALDSHGRLRSFEILIETTSVAANASSAKVLSERVRDSRPS